MLPRRQREPAQQRQWWKLAVMPTVGWRLELMLLPLKPSRKAPKVAVLCAEVSLYPSCLYALLP